MPIGELLPDIASEYRPDVSGRAEVAMLISHSDKVTWATIDDSDLEEAMQGKILDHVVRARFYPGIARNLPVSTFLKIEVNLAKAVLQ